MILVSPINVFRQIFQHRSKQFLKFPLTLSTTSTETMNEVVSEKGDHSVCTATKHGLDDDSLDSEAKKLKCGPEVVSTGDLSLSSNKDGHRLDKRRKVAILMAYSGKDYYGMQKNAGVKTIEDELFSAMMKADMITAEHCTTPQIIQFQRAARTDKGVSAARQVVSLRMVVEDNLTEKINSNLPPQIRVLDVKRTTRGFNSKYWCDARTYSYTLPTFAFTPITEKTTEDYRISDDVFNKVNDVLKLFKGTHNFHNFTSGRKSGEASAQRYIMMFECGRPFLEQGLELATIRIKGQSFMLHQIRKMIGVTIAILRDLAHENVIEKAWLKDKVDIPIAPGVGLVLEEVHYEKYNERYGSDGLHEALDWTALNQTVEDFKKKYIYTTIVSCEMEDKSMLQWLSRLPLHTFDAREAGPPGDVGTRSETRSGIGKAEVMIQLHVENAEKVDCVAPNLLATGDPNVQSQNDKIIEENSSLPNHCNNNVVEAPPNLLPNKELHETKS